MTAKELERSAHDLIADKISNNQEVKMHYMVQEIIVDQGLIEGDAVPFYQLCAKEFVYRIVKKVVDRYDDESVSAQVQQLNFDGFEHLRKAYSLKRNSERVLVPVEQMTDIELLNRAEELESLAKGANAHAREIRRFVSDRSPVQIAA